MQATIALVLGIVLGSFLLLVTRRRKSAEGEPASRSAALAWVVLALGAAAVAVFALGFTPLGTRGILLSVSIALAFAAVASGLGGVIRGDRRWPIWLGLAIALVPAVFWVVFAVGEVVTPH